MLSGMYGWTPQGTTLLWPKGNPMRTVFDRIRQALLFEGIAFTLLVTTGLLFLGFSFKDIGVVAIVGSLIATGWNYAYNLGFDLTLLRINNSTEKSLPARVIHAVGFEVTMLLMMLPFMMWWLDLTLLPALVYDMSFALFFMIYTFIFTWIYDRIFPAPA